MESFSLGPLKVWKETPSKPAIARLVHCHGLGEHSERHRHTFNKLLAHGVEIFRFDHRGSGSSSGERQWIDSFKDYVDDARDVLERAKKESKALPLFLMGHSLGGTVALHLAAERQGDLTGLILSAPAFHIGKGVSPLKLAVGKWLDKICPHLKVPGALDLNTLSRNPQVAIDYKKDPLCCSFSTIHQGNEIVKALKQMPQLAGWATCPILMVHGGSDDLIPLAGSRELIEAMTSSDKVLKEFSGGFHELHNDIIHDEYTDYLAAWIAKRCAVTL